MCDSKSPYPAQLLPPTSGLRLPGGTPVELAREFDRSVRVAANAADCRKTPSATTESEEMARLRHRLREFEQERNILRL